MCFYQRTNLSISYDYLQVFYFSVVMLPTRYLLVQSQQWKRQNNEWNLFKVNKNTRIRLMTSFWFYLLFDLNIIHALFWHFHCWIWASKCRLILELHQWCSYSFLQRFKFSKRRETARSTMRSAISFVTPFFVVHFM